MAVTEMEFTAGDFFGNQIEVHQSILFANITSE